MIKKRLLQIKTLFSDSIDYFLMKRNKVDINTTKNLFVNFKNPNLYLRFFYLLLKFYKLDGYQIFYPIDFKKFRNLKNGNYYLSLILKEKNFLFINSDNLPRNYIEINDNLFSADYFKNYFEEHNKEKAYHIPMSFHPLMYHSGIWNEEVNTNRERINSVFCYGNFDKEAYKEISKTYFKVIDRVDILQLFQNKKGFHSVTDKSNLDFLIQKKISEKFIFAIKNQYSIPMQEVREILSKFNFYLCCPGVVMPLCHNVVEAMSVGTIPIIQKEYAELMYPNLENGKNAIIFNDKNELIRIEKTIFTLSEKDINTMRNLTLEYYYNNLTPNSVVENINRNLNKNPIYLNAEHRSVKFLK